MPSIEDATHLQIPLHDILSATNGFASQNLIANGGFGKVYEGKSAKHGHIAVKRWDGGVNKQGDHEFKTEIALLSNLHHENIVSLLGFCDENDEKIIVYKYESNASLDRHLNNKDLTWIQRLEICLGIARGLRYLHSDVGPQHRILHRDIKSSNILLDENWKPKISDFGLSRVSPANMKCTFVVTNPVGTLGYFDPEYCLNGYLTQKSDVYSFGIVLWEVLCGRLARADRVRLSILVQRHYISGTLCDVIPPYLLNRINAASLLTFSNIAYQCLKNVEERPTMQQVVEQLQTALHDQLAVDESKEPTPTPPPQELVFKVFMHCEDCAKKVRRGLKDLEGVEDVLTDCQNHKVVVRGEKADPLKVLKRIQKNCNRKVKLLSPIGQPPAEEPEKPEQKELQSRAQEPPAEEPNTPEQEEPLTQEEKKDEAQEVITTVLKIHIHCQGCAKDIKKCILKMKGVESAAVDVNNSQIAVKGTFQTSKLVDHVYKGTSKKAVIVNQEC